MSDVAATPDAAPRTEAELQRVLDTRTGSMQALAAGVRLAGRSWTVGLPVALVYGLLSGVLGQFSLDAATAIGTSDPAMVELGAQVAVGAGGLAGLYGVLQFVKRDRVSRASWWPALFAVPLLLTGGAMFLEHSGQAKQLGPVVLQLVSMGWSIVYMTFAGAVAAVMWLRSGDGALSGRSVGFGEAAEEAMSRLLEVAGPHGARVHAVTIGSQLLLPGIFYALQLAFTDAIVVLDPEKRALARSGQLTYGMRGRLFRLMLVWWVVGMALTLGIAFVLQDAMAGEKAMALVSAMLVDPTAIDARTLVVQELIWGVLGWFLTLALLVLYREREAQVRAKSELKKLKQASTG